jgi:CheY-like chemotaxis protein
MSNEDAAVKIAKTETPLRVLLVEDYADLAEAEAEFLRGEGLDVRTAASGSEALEIAPAFQPHLLLCDMFLPDMTGRDVVQNLRSNSSIEGTYTVIVTAMAGGAKAPGDADAVIFKPITSQAIRTLVEASREKHGRHGRP